MSGQRAWRFAALFALAALLAAIVGPRLREKFSSAADPEGAGGPAPTGATADSRKGNASATSKEVRDNSAAAGGAEDPGKQETPEERERKARIARAMDLSTIRALLRTLMIAAVDDNDAIRASTLDGLKRYGSLPRSLIEEELAVATDDRILHALNEALSSAQ